MPSIIAQVRKAIIQVITVATALLALNFLPSNYAGYVAVAVAVLGSILHYLTPNAPDPVSGIPPAPPGVAV